MKLNSEILIGLLGCLIGAGLTAWVTLQTNSRDIDAKMIELSVGILRSEVKPETAPLREWAIDILSKRSGYAFSEPQRAALLKKELPFKGGAFSNGFESGFSRLFPELKSKEIDPGIVRPAPNNSR